MKPVKMNELAGYADMLPLHLWQNGQLQPIS